jgi:OPA family glycerol-3-phosphate transporter-like MFS transporter
MPELEHLYGYTKFQQGLMLGATSFAYGISKFVMGWVSDRSNAKVFLTIGLVCSGIISCLFGFYPALFNNYSLLLFLMYLNGWFQGMGWPPCGRIMVHWFSAKERGAKMAIWNMAHNIGQAFPAVLLSMGFTLWLGWNAALYIPGLLAIVIAFISYYLLEDTPGSVGLPSIEVYKQEPSLHQQDYELEKLTLIQQLNTYIFGNKYLWFLAFANLFVYLTRYAIIDWLPSYLVEVRGFSTEKASFSYSLYEVAGIAGTFLCGWMSDKFFDGRRAPAGVLCMILIGLVMNVYWFAPNNQPLLIDICILLMGFLIYGPVMLIGLHALDLVPKHVAGTAAGFTGLFGYVGGATCANALFGWIVDHYGWDGGFILLCLSCLFATFFLLLTWNAGRPEDKKKFLKEKTVSLRYNIA